VYTTLNFRVYEDRLFCVKCGNVHASEVTTLWWHRNVRIIIIIISIIVVRKEKDMI